MEADTQTNILCALLYRWYLFNSFFGLKQGFQCGFPKFHQSWNLPGIILDSGIPLDMDYFLLNLTKWVSNQFNVMILHTIGSILWFLKPGIPWIWLVFAVYKVFFSLSFFNAKFQSSIIPGIFLELWNSSGNGLFIAKFDIKGFN